MTREEQRNRVRNILQDFYRRGEYELEHAEEDIMRLFPSLPPAEGADPKKVQWSGYGQLGNISQKPLQPTAEGAEEIDARTYLDEWMRQHNYRSNKLIGWSEAVDFAEDFASLTADKLVEERLRNELIKFCRICISAELIGDEIILVDQYLKARSHE